MSAYRGGKGNKNYTGVPEEDQDKLQDLSFAPSTLETVDYAIYDFIDAELGLKTKTNKGVEKVASSTFFANLFSHSDRY